jgi:enediyne biosynthesis protein E4
MTNLAWQILAVTALTTLLMLPTHFENVTQRAGIDFKLTSGTASKGYILESMGGGVGLVDYDNDGWADIFLVNGSTIEDERHQSNKASHRLYHNNRNGTFTDVTEKSGVGGNHHWGMGVCTGDVNNDGFDDLYITSYGPNVLYLNNGDGTFRDFSRESGTNLTGWSSSCAFADYDRDGDLDLYVSSYLEFDVNNLPVDSPICRFRGFKVQCGPRGLTPAAGRLYENLGDGRFVDVTEKSGLGKAPKYYSLGVVWGDYDNDGDVDLFVANDSTPNFLFRNNGDKTFSEIALQAGVALSEDGREQAGMGVDFGDYDNDGNLDLVVTHFSEDYTTLYRNGGDGRFTDVAFAAGIAEASWQSLGWGIQFLDFDLDGFLDLVVANGHVYPEVDQHDIGTTYRQRHYLYRNLKDGKFQELGLKAGPGFQEARPSRGLAVGDINNDGHLDVLIANLDESPSLLVDNSSAGNWLLLKLKGHKSNRSAIGARAILRTGNLTQIREVKSGGSYQSQSDLRLHFGLGSAKRIDELKIRWTDGHFQILKDIPANQILVVEEK